MIRSFLTVSTGTLASRLLGFARDAMLAALLGAGPVADAFLVAFQLVNVVRRLLTEGALNAALVPAWLRVREAEGAMAAAAFAGRVLGTLSAALIVAAALIGLLMPLVISALAPGFAGHPTLRLAVDDARLMLPYLAFAGPVTVMMALLNAQGRFALTAFSPLLFNIALIAVMIALLGWRQDGATAALVIAATIAIAGLLQLSILLLRGGGGPIASPLRIAFDAPHARFPRQGGSRHDRKRLAAIACRRRCRDRVNLARGGVVAVFRQPPDRAAARHRRRRHGHRAGARIDAELARRRRKRGHACGVARSRTRGGLALPATLGLVVLSEPVVRMLFEHGVFTASDTAATAQALAWLALGLPAHVLVKALSPAFFARDDTLTPLMATLKGFAVTLVLSVVLGQIFGASGIAASIAIGAWSGALSLIRRGAASFGFSIDAAARRRLPRIVAAAFAMGGLLWLMAGLCAPGANAHGLVQAALLVLLITGAIAVYGGLLALFDVIRWGEAVNAVRQTAASDLRD